MNLKRTHGKWLRAPATACGLLLSAAVALGQVSAIPDAPAPAPTELLHAPALDPNNPKPQTSPVPAEQKPQTQPASTPAAQPAPDPNVTMFPHSQTARYWISGQANVIFQGKPGFHSPYQGANSFRNAPEYKTSLVETLFLGYQPHRNLRYDTDFLVDLESAGGRGLSEALGLAGFTNLDVVRNPNLGTAPYLARGVIH